MNRRGFVALMDAMIFTAVLMLALSATIGLGLGESADERDAGAMLDRILDAEVRMSDLVEDGDGTPVRISDLCALMLSTGQPGVREYLVDVLEAFSGDRAYRLDLVFGDLSGSIGDGHGTPSVSAEAEVPVTTGGTLLARLSLYGS